MTLPLNVGLIVTVSAPSGQRPSDGVRASWAQETTFGGPETSEPPGGGPETSVGVDGGPESPVGGDGGP
jgi:hypothetical protein